MVERRDRNAWTSCDVADAARGLGASAWEESWPAPWVIRGTVDGRAFYLRERSNTYRVLIAPDEGPYLVDVNLAILATRDGTFALSVTYGSDEVAYRDELQEQLARMAVIGLSTPLLLR